MSKLKAVYDVDPQMLLADELLGIWKISCVCLVPAPEQPWAEATYVHFDSKVLRLHQSDKHLEGQWELQYRQQVSPAFLPPYLDFTLPSGGIKASIVRLQYSASRLHLLLLYFQSGLQVTLTFC